MPGGERKNADSALVLALAAGATNEQAAKQAGVSESTLYRRLKDPQFQQQIADARTATLRQATDRLGAASVAAVSTLLKLLNAQSEATRLGAARAVLEFASKWRESQELEARISALEERIGHQEGRPWGLKSG